MNELASTPSAANPLRQVVEWIIAGHSEPHILEAIGQTWPDAKPKPLIIAALKQIAQSADADSDVIRGFAIEGTRTIYQKAMEVGDLQTALRALKQLIDFAGK